MSSAAQPQASSSRERFTALENSPDYAQWMRDIPEGVPRLAGGRLVHSTHSPGIALLFLGLASLCGGATLLALSLFPLLAALPLIGALVCLIVACASGLGVLGRRLVPQEELEVLRLPCIVREQHVRLAGARSRLGVEHRTRLQTADGACQEYSTREAAAGALRPGDVGVAYVARSRSGSSELFAFRKAPEGGAATG